MRGHDRPKRAVTMPKRPVTMSRNTHCETQSTLMFANLPSGFRDGGDEESKLLDGVRDGGLFSPDVATTPQSGA
jgi:hypothetical protein